MDVEPIDDSDSHSQPVTASEADNTATHAKIDPPDIQSLTIQQAPSKDFDMLGDAGEDLDNTSEKDVIGGAPVDTNAKSTPEQPPGPDSSTPAGNAEPKGKKRASDAETEKPKAKKRVVKTDKVTNEEKGASKAKKAKVSYTESNDDNARIDYDDLNDEGKAEVRGEY